MEWDQTSGEKLRRIVGCGIYIQWNLSITDTVGPNNFVLYSGVSLTEGL